MSLLLFYVHMYIWLKLLYIQELQIVKVPNIFFLSAFDTKLKNYYKNKKMPQKTAYI